MSTIDPDIDKFVCTDGKTPLNEVTFDLKKLNLSLKSNKQNKKINLSSFFSVGHTTVCPNFCCVLYLAHKIPRTIGRKTNTHKSSPAFNSGQEVFLHIFLTCSTL